MYVEHEHRDAQIGYMVAYAVAWMHICVLYLPRLLCVLRVSLEDVSKSCEICCRLVKILDQTLDNT